MPGGSVGRGEVEEGLIFGRFCDPDRFGGRWVWVSLALCPSGAILREEMDGWDSGGERRNSTGIL